MADTPKKQRKTIPYANMRDAVRAGLAIFIVSAITNATVFFQACNELKQEVRAELTDLAKLAALQTDGDAHQRIRTEEDRETRLYQNLLVPYLEILKTHEDLIYIYTVILKDEKAYFILDAEISRNGEEVVPSAVMEEYPEASATMLNVLQEHVVAAEADFSTDMYGTVLSAYAPFYSKAGAPIGIVGVDMSAAQYLTKELRLRHSLYLSLLIAAGVSCTLGFLVAAMQQRERATKQDYESLINQVPAVFFRCAFDRQWTMHFMNAQTLALTGYPVSDFIGNAVRSFNSIIHTDDQDQVYDTLLNHTTPEYTIEYRIVCADGSVKWLYEQGLIHRNAANEIIGLDGFIRDITPKKRNQRTIEEKQRLLQLAESMAKVGTWRMDLGATTPQWSDETFRIHGLKPGQDPQPDIETAIGFYHPEDRAYVQESISESIQHLKRFHFTKRLIRSDGKLRYVEAVGMPETDKHGHAITLVGTFQDVTDQMEYQSRLEESEARFRSMANSTPNLLWIADTQGHYSFVNQTWLDFTNAHHKIKKKSRWDSYIHPEDVDICLKKYRDAVLNKTRFEIWYRLLRHDGAYRWMLDVGVPRLREDGECEGFIGSCTDITESRTAYESLKKERLFAQAVMDAIPDPIFVKDHTHAWRAGNRAFWTLMGGEATQFIGNPVCDISIPDKVSDAWAKEEAVIQQGVAYHYEENVTSAGGQTISAIISKSPLAFPDGNPGLVGVIHDITERKQFEAILRNERERLTNIITATEVGTWEWNIQTGEVLFNDRWAGMLGYTLAELEPLTLDTWIKLSHPDDLQQATEELEAHFERETTDYIVEVRMRHKQRHWVWVLARGRVISWTNEGKPLQMYGTHIDITARKYYEEELTDHRDNLQALVYEQTRDLVAQKERAEASVQAKSEFLANMSHELRTPMHAILNYASMGQKRIGTSDHEKLSKYLTNIQTAGTRLLGLLNNLLDLTKMESGKMTFHMEESDLRTLVTNAHMELESLLKEKELAFTSLFSIENLHATFDSTRMMQVLINIIGNAIKFSPSGSRITLSVDPGMMPDTKEEGILISIRDEGEGIPTDELSSVFDEFVQSSKTKTGAGGTGLGLSICRQIILAHHGVIWAENVDPQGAVFYVLIPRAHTILNKE